MNHERVSLQIYPIKIPRIIDWGESVLTSLQEGLRQYPLHLQSGDIVAITSKAISMEQKARVWLEDIIPSEEAKQLVQGGDMDPRVAQVVINESTEVFGTVCHNIMSKTIYGLSASAGIDLSNCPEGYALLLPKDCDKSAAQCRQQIKDQLHVNVGVLIVDSRLVPLRKGTSGIALGLSGFQPLQDERGKQDLYDAPIKMTVKAVADNLANMANFVMGETTERTPYAIIRGTRLKITDEPVSAKEAFMSEDECIYFAPFIKYFRDAQKKHPNH